MYFYIAGLTSPKKSPYDNDKTLDILSPNEIFFWAELAQMRLPDQNPMFIYWHVAW